MRDRWKIVGLTALTLAFMAAVVLFYVLTDAPRPRG